MHDFGGSDHRSTKNLADALMAEAYAEQGSLADRVGDQGVRNSGVCWRARTRDDEDAIRLHRIDAGEVDLVIAAYDRCRSELTNVLDQVVDKGVVVVDDQYRRHGVQR